MDLHFFTGQSTAVNGKTSENVVLNTGLPQGCVLSPILFSIYINEMTCDNDNLTLIKYADDMALVGRVKDIQSLDTYLNFVNYITIWTEESFLQLNISKTKEMCCGAKSVLALCEPF